MIDMHVSLFKYLLLKCFNTWTKNDYVIQYCWYRQRHISYTLFFWWLKLPFFIQSVFFCHFILMSVKNVMCSIKVIYKACPLLGLFIICWYLNKIFLSENFVLIKTIQKKGVILLFFHTQNHLSLPLPP